MNKFFKTAALCLFGLGNISAQIGGATGTGQWSTPIQFPLIPVSVANLPNGKLLVWSAEHTHTFGEGGEEHTETALFDPVTKVITQSTAGHAHHNMFCPGINNLADGKLLVTGGISTKSTSIYDPATNTWSEGPNMNFGRGYQGAVTLSSGAAFTVGGSWSGGDVGKLAEIYSPNSPANGWNVLPNISVPLTIMDGATDPQGQYRNDNHAWMFVAPNGNIFHAGPSTNMHWLTLTNGGGYSLAKARGTDDFAMEGVCVMYEKGKLLKVGGSTSYSSMTPASKKTFTIDINNASNVVVEDVPDMKYPRIFHNSVILPNGEVFVVGGMDHAEPFSDAGSVLIPEIWNPTTKAWRDVKAMVKPRNYHSVAILQPDGTVFVGGGGLCGVCETNHDDAEIFSPSYLFNTNGTTATRPVISTAPTTANNNASIQVSTSGSVSYFSLIRLSSTTHSTNNEQRYRRVPFSTVNSTTYNLTIEDANVLVPGHYMLFAVNANGTPSLAKTIKIGTASNICTIKPEYTIDGITKNGQVALGVAAGKSMVLSAFPKSPTFTIKRPNGTTVSGDLNLGVLTTAQSGKYSIYVTSTPSCSTTLDLTVTNCTPTSIAPEYNINEVWTTGTANQTLTVNKGDNLTFSAMPNEIAVASITLPDGREVTDNFGINPILPQHSGVYKMLSVQGCETNLNLIVPCNITPQYLLNNNWITGTNDQVLTVQPGTALALSIAGDGIPVSIKLPNGKFMPDGYAINSVSNADTGTYTFITNEGCFTSLKLRIGNCPASRIIPEYLLDNVWTAGTQNQELVVTAGKPFTISMLPNIAAPLTITRPNGTTSGDHLYFASLTAQNSGTYTLTADGCTTTLKLKVNNCTTPLLPEYAVNNTWFTTTSGQQLTLAAGLPLTLSIIPNGPGLTLTKPDGTTAGDHFYIPSLSSANAGIYTFTSSEGCVAKLNIGVGKCPAQAVVPEYSINNGPWLSANSGSAITVPSGGSFTLSMLPNDIAATIKKPNGTVVPDAMVLTNFNSSVNGVYTITSSQGCSAKVTLSSSGARTETQNTELVENSELVNAQTMSIYPNPFTDKLDIVWNDQDAYHKLLLTDITGKILFTENLVVGQNSVNLNLAPLNLQQGTYLIRIEGNEKSLSRLLYKQ